LLIPALLNPALFKPALLKLLFPKPASRVTALLELALLETLSFETGWFERRLSTGNPCIHVSGFPFRGNHVAQTCTGRPSGSLGHPPRPGFMSKYRNHHAPLPSPNPSRKNHTSYRRRIESALNRSLSVFIGGKE